MKIRNRIRKKERGGEMVEWKKTSLDITLVPLSLVIWVLYHAWLCHRVRFYPHTTIIAINSTGRRYWVSSVMADIEKKNILAVQTLRNMIMGSTLMATTSILICCGLAAVISSTYSVKKPLGDEVYGSHMELMIAGKYVTILVFFLTSFVCHTMSIRMVNQVNFLVNCFSPPRDPITPTYVTNLLEKGMVVNIVGNRVFYSALALLLWIFGPLFVFFASISIILLFYNLDIVFTFPKSTLVDGGVSDFV